METQKHEEMTEKDLQICQQYIREMETWQCPHCNIFPRKRKLWAWAMQDLVDEVKDLKGRINQND